MIKKYATYIEAPTEEIAIHNALIELGVTKEEVEIITIKKPKKNIFGKTIKLAKFKVSILPHIAEAIKLEHEIFEKECFEKTIENKKILENTKKNLRKKTTDEAWDDAKLILDSYFVENSINLLSDELNSFIIQLIKENRRIELIHIIRKNTSTNLETAKIIEQKFIEYIETTSAIPKY